MFIRIYIRYICYYIFVYILDILWVPGGKEVKAFHFNFTSLRWHEWIEVVLEEEEVEEKERLMMVSRLPLSNHKIHKDNNTRRIEKKSNVI